ncbi:hypothetical protein E6P78_11540 [Streptomyces sp. A0958]|nr:hypothetical protein E6P78_11540 [Streptomyces sp. A0958]
MFRKSRLPGDAWHARSRRCRKALPAPLRGFPAPCDRTHQTPPGPPSGRTAPLSEHRPGRPPHAPPETT